MVLAVRAAKPASLYVKLAGPIAHAKQAGATRKLLDAAQRIAQEPAPQPRLKRRRLHRSAEESQ